MNILNAKRLALVAGLVVAGALAFSDDPAPPGGKPVPPPGGTPDPAKTADYLADKLAQPKRHDTRTRIELLPRVPLSSDGELQRQLILKPSPIARRMSRNGKL